MKAADSIKEIRTRAKITQSQLAQYLGASLVSVNRWERGATEPSPAQLNSIQTLLLHVKRNDSLPPQDNKGKSSFASRGLIRSTITSLPLFRPVVEEPRLLKSPSKPIIQRVKFSNLTKTRRSLKKLLSKHPTAAPTATKPPLSGMSAGKNTYTYDAHTYHTKVPPQGIAEIIKHYLPNGGLVLDSFSGSGMTGVAARAIGVDCILNELSPAASFISQQFTSSIDPALFEVAIETLMSRLQQLREQLYSTKCRECGRKTEVHYFVWSYKVICPACEDEFVLWDHCRQYGNSVKEHKILSEFECPCCQKRIKKSSLKRTSSVPVQLGYKCCSSHLQHSVHPLTKEDIRTISEIETGKFLCKGFFPTNELPDGVNLRQPVKHGLNTIDKFYSARNLSALSHIWHEIHLIEDDELAAFLAFVFTSLYQRVSRLSEFRFWGGSGNTARFNVPFIFNETNVFLTFLRKARSIKDHLETTAAQYSAECIVLNGTATDLSLIPDSSVDLIFTDPPFGANINYSEMNFLWESWLRRFTNTTNEAIMNRVQGKGVQEYQNLMKMSLSECCRVLRDGHWMLLVFMNSSDEVWQALRNSITEAGFSIESIDTFDKQHGTFKQFVSDNTAGMDLVLHCKKVKAQRASYKPKKSKNIRETIDAFMRSRQATIPTNVYMHVGRNEEVDHRTLYSEWLTSSLASNDSLLSFSEFRLSVEDWLKRQ